MKPRSLLLIAGSLVAIAAIPAFADVNYTQGSGTVIFDFLCFTTKHCPAHVNVNSAGTEIGTGAAPVRTDPTGATTQPVSGAFYQGTQPVSIATMPSTPVTGTFFQATQPISATSLPLPALASTSTNQVTQNASLATIATAVTAPIPAGTANIGNVGQISQYPIGAVVVTASATGTTAATTATLAGAATKTTYICGYSIRANATAAVTVTNTLTGVITATMSSIMWVAPLASGIGVDEQIFFPCIPASATNTGIAIVSGAPGAGGTVSSKGWGYQL